MKTRTLPSLSLSIPTLAVVLAAWLGGAPKACAESIGANFMTGGDVSMEVSRFEVAGAWPQRFWHNFSTPQGQARLSDADDCSMGSTFEAYISGFAVQWSAESLRQAMSSTTTPDGRMMASGLYSSSQIQLTFTDCPFGSNDALLVYFNSGAIMMPSTVQATLTAGSQTIRLYGQNRPFFLGTHSRIPSTSTNSQSGPVVVGNYFVFTGILAPQMTLTLTGNDVVLTGFQFIGCRSPLFSPLLAGNLQFQGTVDEVFSAPLAADMGATFAVDNLPPGLGLDPVTGVISGIPSVAGNYTSLVRLQNAVGASTNSISFTIVRRPSEYQVLETGIAGMESRGYGLNDRRQVVGAFRNEGGVWRPFSWTWTNSFAAMLGDSGGSALGVNNNGVIVGHARTASGRYQAVKWVDYQAAPLLDITNVDSYATAINLSGEISGSVLGSPARGFLLTKGSQVNLPVPIQFADSFGLGLNNWGTVAGYLRSAPVYPQHAAYWKAAQLATDIGHPGLLDLSTDPLDPANNSAAEDINDNMEAVGNATAGVNGQYPFLHKNGTNLNLCARPGYLGGWANAINNQSVVVGAVRTVAGGAGGWTRAFVWDATNGLRDLNSLLPAGSGWELLEAHDINERGDIAGAGRRGGVIRAFLLAANAARPILHGGPEDLECVIGTEARFNLDLEASNGARFQWWFNGQPLAGATNRWLTLSNAQPSNVGRYYVVIQDGGVWITSRVARLKVVVPPVIVQQPVGYFGGPGTNLTLSVVAEGSPLLGYQWLFNGTPLPLGTNASLMFQPVTAADVGRYRVVVTNLYGRAESREVTMEIIDPARLSLSLLPGLLLEGKAGQTIRVEWRDALATTESWQPLATVTLTNTAQWHVDFTATNASRRFYRAVLTGQ